MLWWILLITDIQWIKRGLRSLKLHWTSIMHHPDLRQLWHIAVSETVFTPKYNWYGDQMSSEIKGKQRLVKSRPQSADTSDVLYDSVPLQVTFLVRMFHDGDKPTPQGPGRVQPALDMGSWGGQEWIPLIKATPQVGPWCLTSAWCKQENTQCDPACWYQVPLVMSDCLQS